jgi:hypothetical protein
MGLIKILFLIGVAYFYIVMFCLCMMACAQSIGRAKFLEEIGYLDVFISIIAGVFWPIYIIYHLIKFIQKNYWDRRKK